MSLCDLLPITTLVFIFWGSFITCPRSDPLNSAHALSDMLRLHCSASRPPFGTNFSAMGRELPGEAESGLGMDDCLLQCSNNETFAKIFFIT